MCGYVLLFKSDIKRENRSLVMSLVMSCFVLSFPHEMSWMRSGTELSQCLGIFLLTLARLFALTDIGDSSTLNHKLR